MDKDIISIIVPVYKVEKYLRKCIESIINQTYKDIEIILVDDGSPDKCPEICDEYAEKDKRIKVLHQKNLGLSIARNNGIKMAKGNYIGFVDSDDYIETTMFDDLYRALIDNKSEISICDFYVINQNNKYVKNLYPEKMVYNKEELLKEILLDKNIQSYAWNKLYKKELFDNITYPEGKKYEDIGTTFYLAEKCSKVVVIGKPEYNYINRNDSIVFNIDEKTILDYTDIIMERYDYVDKSYNDLKVYNYYYLAKTLITADKDVKSIRNISESLKRQLYKLFTKVKNESKKYEKKAIILFNNEQIEKLNDILCDNNYCK